MTSVERRAVDRALLLKHLSLARITLHQAQGLCVWMDLPDVAGELELHAGQLGNLLEGVIYRLPAAAGCARE